MNSWLNGQPGILAHMRTTGIELGFFASRDETGPVPGVVMIHDVWGLTDHTRDLATRLAGEGFAVLALDLYRRLGDVKIENPGAWMRGLSDPQILGDAQAGIDFLAAQPATQGSRIGITGFCMGGMYALMAGCSCTGLSASVPFYGLLSHRHGILYDEQGLDPALKPREPLDAVRDLSCPTLAFFGDQDEFIPLADIEQLRARMAETGQPAEAVVYPGAGHAFMNDTRPDAFRPDDAADAWAKMVEFLRKRLG
ncbi:MAG: dienelactone hydrolase family protein [Myxococcota bacterium]